MLDTPLIERFGFQKHKSNFDSEAFFSYLSSRAGGKREPKNAKPIVAEITKFYERFEPSNPYFETLLSMQNLTQHLETISEQKSLQATTIGEKLRRFQAAIDYVLYKENPTGDDDVLFTRCQRIKTNLAKWGKALKKDKKLQELANSERSTQQVY